VPADRSRSLTGLVVIVAGIIILLNNLGFTHIRIWDYWPVILIIWGLNSAFTGSKKIIAVTISLIVVLLGITLLSGNLGLFTVNIGLFFRLFWPLLIIIIGLSVVFNKSLPGKTNWAFMGGMERGKDTEWHLTTGSYLAFMGGIDLDLRKAVIADGETVLDLTAIMGGIEIKVPADLGVTCDGFAILGGVEMLGRGSGGIIGSTRAEQQISTDDGKKVIIQARAFMGGVEIKRV